MPRAHESRETQILNWFKTAPLAVANLIFGLVRDEMRQRTLAHDVERRARESAQRTAAPAHAAPAPTRPAAPKPPAPKPAQGKKKAAKPAGKPKPPQAKKKPTAGAPKRSHHKKKPTPVHHPPAQVDPGPGEVGDFGDDGEAFTLPETE